MNSPEPFRNRIFEHRYRLSVGEACDWIGGERAAVGVPVAALGVAAAALSR